MFDKQALRALEARLAAAAAEELMPRFLRVEVQDKQDGTLVTEADLEMQARMQRELADAWPQFKLLGEEMSADEQQALLVDSSEGLWVLDPLDGTSNFTAGIPFFGVSLALIIRGQLHAGIVYDPVRRESFSALAGQGAWMNGTPLRVDAAVPTLKRSMAMVDLKRLPGPLVTALAQQSPYRSQRSFGSVALDWCWLASNRSTTFS